MNIHFYKYQGTGNDFIMVDNRTGALSHDKLSQDRIKQACHRNMGIGADGFILLNTKQGYDFEMEYYNSDGNQSTMCGNGGRCIVAFAKQLGIIESETNFIAIDGEHQATINNGNISLQMKNVDGVIENETFYQLDTGSPHYVTFVDDVNDINVAQEGKMIRNSPRFEAEGINVNFVETHEEHSLFVRTYERGVEDETLSCGTGVTACSLVQMTRENINEVHVETLGGNLSVTATKTENGFTAIRLIGPATFVYEGDIKL